MHDDILLPCSFCTLFPHFMLVFFSIPVLWEHICILNARLGGETDQQNVIMHKAYCIVNGFISESFNKDLTHMLIGWESQ